MAGQTAESNGLNFSQERTTNFIGEPRLFFEDTRFCLDYHLALPFTEDPFTELLETSIFSVENPRLS